MLSHLTIQNYALIDELKVDFSSGFSVITGETGAGKSILLGGLSLILGKRADLSVIKDSSKKCIVEAVFNISKYNLHQVFDSYDLDYDELTYIRREILPSGKSRAFINDSPVLLDTMQHISAYLIDIHSQHQTLQLSQLDFQMNLVDSLSGNTKELGLFHEKFRLFKKLKNELKQLHEKSAELTKEYDYNVFMLNELKTIKLDQIQLSEIENEHTDLSNAEEISLLMTEAAEIIKTDDYGILATLNSLKQKLNKLNGLSESFSEIKNRVDSVFIELDDVSSELELKLDHFSSNPQRLEELTNLLSILNNLFYKHQKGSVEELIEIQKNLEETINLSSNSGELLKQCEASIAEVDKELAVLSKVLDKNRLALLPSLKSRLEASLSLLGMPNAKFEISILPSESYNSYGKSELKLLFSANKGADFGPLDKVASGGELSRIMLAIKSILSEYKNLPTIMFDEIDTGVSGEISDQMGNIMMSMSQHMQVFAITHLPQIAAKGKSHFRVYKYDEEEVTKTQLEKLNEEERVQEIAKMLAGSNISNSAVEHAKQLLN